MTFQSRIHAALQDDHLQLALDGNYRNSTKTRTAAMASLPYAEETRDRARAIRLETLAHLDKYLTQLEVQVRAHGGVVHWAETASQAANIVLQIAQAKGVELVAKSKSMVTEEIDLNKVLQRSNVQVVETDLGEYIIQLRGDHPSHIVAPAIHLTRTDVAQLFESHLGLPDGVDSETFQRDIPLLIDTARTTLRHVFLEAGVGVSGVNFAVAQSGALCLVTNEGNGRLVTTAPPVHVAVMGIERVVPTMADLEIMLRVLARSATGQKITSYTTIVAGPRRDGEHDGPDELHLVLVDNGRSHLLGSDLYESLLCIRCGACLNICPVYREIGGHAYNSVYSGPIGAIISPALGGMEEHGELAQASTLCGACQEVCPVRIDIPSLLLKTRALHVMDTQGDPIWNWGMKLWSWVMRSPALYVLGLWVARCAMRILTSLVSTTLLSKWTGQRDFPSVTKQTFRARWDNR